MEMLSKKQRIVNRVTSMIIGCLIGAVLVVIGTVIKAETLVWLALVIWGVIIIIGNVPGLVSGIANIKKKAAVFDLVLSVIAILLGVGLIISQNQVVTLILAAYMIVFPVIRIVLARGGRVEQLKREALRIILGVLLMVFGGTLIGLGYTILNFILKILGWVVIGVTLVFGALEIFFVATKKQEKNRGPIYVEHEEN